MPKLSLSLLATSLLAAGLLTSGSANAATYNVAEGCAKYVSSANPAITDSRIFNWSNYVGRYPDLKVAGITTADKACQHWTANGLKEARQAHPTFYSAYYLSLYPDLRAAFGATNYAAAAKHWVDSGIAEGRTAAPGAAPAPVTSTPISSTPTTSTPPKTSTPTTSTPAPSAPATSTPPKTSTPTTSAPSTPSTSAPVVAAPVIEVAEGCAGLAPANAPEIVSTSVFQWQFYLQANDDLLRAGYTSPAQACRHWVANGLKEGRQAHPGFHSKQYISRYSDLKVAFGTNYQLATQHYVTKGMTEKRIGYLENHAAGTELASVVSRGTIAAGTSAGPLYVSASKRSGGAIDSVMYKNVEFINSFDLGRELQVAYSESVFGECYNPTEAGSLTDAVDPAKVGSSTSTIVSWTQSGSHMTSQVTPAFWMRPGEKNAGCGTARNTTRTADNVTISKTVDIGYNALSNVIAYQTTINVNSSAEKYPVVPGGNWSMAIEAPTGYMTERFNRMYSFHPGTGAMTDESGRASACIQPGATIGCEQGKPLIFADSTNLAMGVCATQTNTSKYRAPVYGVFAFPAQGASVANTYKWNVVDRWIGPFQGPVSQSFKTLIAVGTLDDVKTAMRALYLKGECVTN